MDIKPANVLAFPIPIIKVTKKKELEMAFGKKCINCRLDDLGETRSFYT